MADILQRLDELVWSKCTYTPKELAARPKCLPMVVKVTYISTGNCFYNKFPIDQVLYLYAIKEQFRFMAIDTFRNQIGIPINSPVKFLEPCRDAEVILTTDMQLPRLIQVNLQNPRERKLSQLMLLTNENRITMNIGKSGWMRYMFGVCLSKDEVGKSMESIPVVYSGIRFSVALDLRNETIDDFLKFESCLKDLVTSIHQEALTNYQGSTDFTVNFEPNLTYMLEEISTTTEVRTPILNTQVDKSEDKGEMMVKTLTEPNQSSYEEYDYPIMNDESLTSPKAQTLPKAQTSPTTDMKASAYSSDEEYDYPYMERDCIKVVKKQCNDGYLIPDAHLKHKRDSIYENMPGYPIGEGKEASNTTQKTKGGLEDMQQGAQIIQKQATLEDDEDYYLLIEGEDSDYEEIPESTSSDDSYDYPIGEGKEVRNMKQKTKGGLDHKQGACARSQQQATLEDDEDYLVPIKVEVRKLIPSKKNISNTEQSIDNECYVSRSKHKSQGYDIGREISKDNQKYRQENYRFEFSSNILENEIISQHRKLKQTFPSKAETASKSGESISDKLDLQNKQSTSNKEENVTTNSEETVEGRKHRSYVNIMTSQTVEASVSRSGQETVDGRKHRYVNIKAVVSQAVMGSQCSKQDWKPEVAPKPLKTKPKPTNRKESREDTKSKETGSEQGQYAYIRPAVAPKQQNKY